MRDRSSIWLTVVGVACAAVIAGCGGDDAPLETDAGHHDAGDAGAADAHVDHDAGPEPECTTADDCALGGSVCGVATCIDGECGVAPAPAGTECRAPLGACDVAEVCDGESLDCPDDVVLAADTECRASAGVCDVAEVCDGASAECPADAIAPAGNVCRARNNWCDGDELCDGASVECPTDTEMVVSLCEPSFTYSALGRNLTATTINLNGTGTPVATVSPGSTVSLRVVGGWIDSNTDCGSCITQFYARMNGVFSLCFGNAYNHDDDYSFDRSTTFPAPTEPGVYYVQLAWSWEHDCQTTTSAPTTFGPRTMATLIVQ